MRGLRAEVEVASQRDTIARANLKEALELFIETASETEITERLPGEVYVTTLEVVSGVLASELEW